MIFVYIYIYYYDLKNRCKIMLIIIIRYKYTASDFQSPIREIPFNCTLASNAKEAPPRLKECVPYLCEGIPKLYQYLLHKRHKGVVCKDRQSG